ncbi:MAG TPA: DUF58 domain-containing protein [Abditibacteriaceae bacterium]|jgi:uncharacterized protein (DUF58 family)
MPHSQTHLPLHAQSNETRRFGFHWKAQPAGPRAFYGIEKAQLQAGLPPASGAHDAAYFNLINTTGLAGPWRVWNERLTPAGRWTLLAGMALFISGINSLELQSYVPLLYIACFWLCAAGAWFFCRPQAALQVRHAERICAGETLPVEAETVNRGRHLARDWRIIAHRLPPSLGIEPEEGTPVPLLAPGEKSKSEVSLLCHQRGIYSIQGWRVETSFPFGLLNSARVFKSGQRLVVYPAFTPLESLAIPSGRRHHPGGVAFASHLGDSFEFLGNREYRDGDNPRDIDWRATARLQTPIVREYREEYFLRMAIVLDTHLPQPTAENKASFERAVSVAASIGDFMARREYLVDIFAAGPDLYHLLAGRSLAYLDQILDILAGVEANPLEPFAALEPEILDNLEQINAIVCVFLDWNEVRRAFCENLARSGVGLKVIIVRDSPCTDEPMADAEWLGRIPVITTGEFSAGVNHL